MAENIEFETWWASHGQFCRAGGGDYEKTFAFRAWEAAKKGVSKPILLNGNQLLAALEWCSPTVVGFINAQSQLINDEEIKEELDTQVYIHHKEAGLDSDGDEAPEGYYCWLEEYPEEGALLL